MRTGGGGGLTAHMIEMEAYIDWNAPPIDKAKDIIKEALDHHFKGKRWHFFQTSLRGRTKGHVQC